MALVKVLTCNQINQAQGPFANGPSAPSLALLSGTYPSQFGMSSSALDNDSNGPRKSAPAMRDVIRRGTIDQLNLSSYRPPKRLKSGLSLPALDHSVLLSLFHTQHPDIDRASRTLSELVFTMTTLADDNICMHPSTRSVSATSCLLGCGIGSWMVDSCSWNSAPPLSSLWTLHPYLCREWLATSTGTSFVAKKPMWTTFWSLKWSVLTC